MDRQDVLDYSDDAHDLLETFGAEGELTNVTWRTRVASTYDTLYEEDTTKEYLNIELMGYFAIYFPKADLEMEGYDKKNIGRLYVMKEEFVRRGIEPKESDTFIFNGLHYEIKKIRPLHFGGNPFLYIIYAAEAMVSVQNG